MKMKRLACVLLNLLFIACGSAMPGCVQDQTCRLPDCFCPTFDHPSFNNTKDIPQFVYFGFDDALNIVVHAFYKQLFNESRLNPNGCPVTVSLYVQDLYTDYSLVGEHQRRGNEIGCHSVNHSNVDTADKLRFEAGQQKDNVINKGGVPRSQVVGWRSPNLQTAGDAQPDVLKSLNYTYDISLTYSRQLNDRVPWPYTLDFGYPYSCSVPPCPGWDSTHPGFWEVPVFSLKNPETAYECAYVDSCRPSSEAAALNYLWSNFEKVYNSNRAPFGLNMHAAWFYFDNYRRATDTFIRQLLQLNDVYIVSVKQILEWMQDPVKISDIPQKLPSWGCSNPVTKPQQETTAFPA